MAIPCRQAGVAQVRPRSKPKSSSPIQDRSLSQCHGLDLNFIECIWRLRTSPKCVSLLTCKYKQSSLGMWRSRETLKWRISLSATETYFNFMYIPYVCNASSDWILFPSAIRCDTECWIQRRTGNTRRLLLFKSTCCTFLKPLRKFLPSPEMLLLPTYKFTRQHFNEHSPGSDANLLFSKFSVDISRIPQNAPTSMRSRHIPPKLYSYNNERDGVSNHKPHDCLFTQLFIQAKENIKAPRHWPLWGEFTGDRWIPLTKGQ